MTDRSRVDAGSRIEPDLSLESSQLSDEQWSLISDLFSDPPPGPRGGRLRADARRCVEGILWVLCSGACWKDLSRSYPSYATCWRRFVAWSISGIWDQVWLRFVNRLDEQGKVDWEEGFADATFASAKKGVISLVPPSEAKAASSCSWSMAMDWHWPSM